MRITSLQPQGNNPERINVYVDGHFLLGVHARIVHQLALALDQELSPEQLEQLRNEEALQLAIDRALNYLSFRPRSRQEIRRYLRRKETPPALVETALARLDALELVNDYDFASFWIETREQFSPRGTHALKNELYMKGIEREIVDDLVDEEQDEELAMRAGHKKAVSLLRSPDIDFTTFRTRLGAFLQRRGFGYEVAARTVKALWKELR